MFPDHGLHSLFLNESLGSIPPLKKQPSHHKTIRYRGKIDAGSDSIPVILLIEFDKYDFTSVSCEVTPVLSGRDNIRALDGVLTGHFDRPLIVKPASEDAPIVRFHGIRGWRSDGSSMSLELSGFDINVSGVTLPPGWRVYTTVDLTSGKVLSKPRGVEYDRRGNVAQKFAYEDDVEWALPMGRGIAFLRFESEKTQVGRDEATLLVCRPTIEYDLSIERQTSLEEVTQELERDLADVCLLLSLCGRRRVIWYQSSYLLIDAEQTPAHTREPISRYAVFDRLAEGPRDELINHEALTKGGFQRLLDRLRTSPYREELKQVILFLASSQTADTIETSYFLCHAALEALCNAIYPKELGHDLLPYDEWKKIESTLRQAIVDFAAKSGAAAFGEKASARISDLKRVGTRDRIVSICRHLGLGSTEIWPGVALEAGLGRALKVRNELFHGAKTADLQNLYVSLVRLQILTERLLLRILDWPNDKIWQWYDQHLRRIPEG